MNQVDPQLVQTIADLVVEALSSRDGAAAAAVRPPAGLCTAGDGSSQPSEASTIKTVTVSNQHDAKRVVPTKDRPLLDGIITSHRLEDAIASSPDGVVVLAMGARLTPLAQDIVRANPTRIRRENVSEQGATLKHLNHGLPWAWWTCCQCDVIQQVVSERAGMLLPLAVPRQSSAIAEAVMDADAMIRSGRVAGAVLFVRQAARPMCLANRRRALRAVLGHCDEAVQHAIHAIGANTLILEYPYVSYEQIATRMDLVMRSKTQAPTEMKRYLASVEGGVH